MEKMMDLQTILSALRGTPPAPAGAASAPQPPDLLTAYRRYKLDRESNGEAALPQAEWAAQQRQQRQ
jgi:hypothetical protein